MASKTINQMQEYCNCDEPCNYYMKITTNGDKLVKLIINKCAKNSKRNVCEYISETKYCEEPIEEINTKIEEVNSTTKIITTEFERIKGDILSNIEEFNYKSKTNISTYLTLEKMRALSTRIRLLPFCEERETIDDFKKRVIICTPKYSSKAENPINVIPLEEYPFLNVIINKPQLKKPANKQKSYFSIITTKCAISCSDDEESDDDNPFDMENDDSEVEDNEYEYEGDGKECNYFDM